MAKKKAGIEPATGERAEILEALSKAAFEMIKVIELERSGIRDGDGYWHGGDVIGHMTGDLVDHAAGGRRSRRNARLKSAIPGAVKEKKSK